MLAAGVARVVAGSLDPNPEAGGGLACSPAGLEPSWSTVRARRRTRRGAPGCSRRPFVLLKAPVTLDGRVTVRARAGSPASVTAARARAARAGRRGRGRDGDGPGRAPRLGARDVDAARQPRRLAFGRGRSRAPSSSCAGALEDELRALADEGVQSLLLEGGPTLGRAFLEADLVDKLLLFIAPLIAGTGPVFRSGPRKTSPI